MTIMRTAGAALAAAVLAGCGQPNTSSGVSHHGRYAGVGIYAPGDLWSKIVTASQPTTPATAKTADDEAIIVVVDGNTGEIRQCGNLSGYCVGMKPWSNTLMGAQVSPVSLTAHTGSSNPESTQEKTKP